MIEPRAEPTDFEVFPESGCKGCGNRNSAELLLVTKFMPGRHMTGGGYNVIVGTRCNKCGSQWSHG